MKRKIDELRETLDEFVTQVDYSVLVVGCLPEELAYVATFLQAVEGSHPESFFVTFAHPFTTAEAYVDGIVENLRTQLEVAAPERAKRCERPFPALPLELSDKARPPQDRLRYALEFLGKLLPSEPGHSMVVGLLPLQCSNFEAYATLMMSVFPSPKRPAWMAPLRIVAYDDRSANRLAAVIEASKTDTVLRYAIDFSTAALTDELSRSAADLSQPVGERMMSMLQLAALDYAHKRYAEALAKYGVLHDYYREQNIPAVQALCLVGAGDTLRAGGQLVAAKEMLQRGIGLAMAEKALPILLNLLMSVTDLCAQLGQHEEAESYADSGMKVAAGLLNPFAFADFDEKKGDAQAAQGRAADALATYGHCAGACENNHYFYRWKSVLGKQAGICQEVGMQRELRRIEADLTRAEALELSGGASGSPSCCSDKAHATPGGHDEIGLTHGECEGNHGHRRGDSGPHVEFLRAHEPVNGAPQ